MIYYLNNFFIKYRTAVAHRCFAFDPSEDQPDDTKGLIMIPNVGEMNFYMSTMISDFANNILTEFGNLVCLLIYILYLLDITVI